MSARTGGVWCRMSGPGCWPMWRRRSGCRRRSTTRPADGRRRRSAHAPGRVLTDLAVLLADGGEAITDLAVLRHQPGLFGPVASTATAWRVLDAVDDSRSGRAEAGSGGGAGTGLAAARPRRAGRSRRCAAPGSRCRVW